MEMQVSRVRLLELAQERLEEERTKIDQELEAVQAELASLSSNNRKPRSPGRKKRSRRGRRPMTAEERKAHSKRMREYWAERKRREQAQP